MRHTHRPVVALASAALILLSACAARIEYPTDPAFAACYARCDENLKKFDFPASCYLASKRARRSWKKVVGTADEVGYAFSATDDACGCLTSKLTADGRLADIEVAFTDSEDSARILVNSLASLQFDLPIQECLVDAIIPVVFGYKSASWLVEHGRRHTIYPIYQFISRNALTEIFRVPAKQQAGWSGLNVYFGILNWNGRRYLTQGWYYCLPLEETDNISLYRRAEEIGTIPVHRIRVDDCPIDKMYPITADQALELKRIALADGPDWTWKP